MSNRLPGVIVRIVPDAGIVSLPLFERYPVIMGGGETELLVSDENVIRGTGVLDPLTKTPVFRIISIGDLPGVPKYDEGIDYVLTGNSVDWTPGAQKPITGNRYYVTYTHTPVASTYEPMLYFDENLIYVDHGQKTKVDGNINPIVNGASIAFQSGARGVIVVQRDPTIYSLDDAYLAMVEKLKKLERMKLFLVPMDVGGTINAILFNHCVLSSTPENAQERTLIVSSPMGTTRDQFIAAAISYRNLRAVVPAAYLGEVMVTGFGTTLYDQVYLSAACGGLLCSGDIGMTYTDEVLAGITLNGDFTIDERRLLVGNGVSPVTQRGEVVRWVFPITTDPTSAFTEDLGVQDISDFTKKTWREKLWDQFRNAPITPATIGSMVTFSKSVFDRMIQDGYITGYKSISIMQDQHEPRQINVRGKVQPTWRAQFFDVEFVFTATL